MVFENGVLVVGWRQCRWRTGTIACMTNEPHVAAITIYTNRTLLVSSHALRVCDNPTAIGRVGPRAVLRRRILHAHWGHGTTIRPVICWARGHTIRAVGGAGVVTHLSIRTRPCIQTSHQN